MHGERESNRAINTVKYMSTLRRNMMKKKPKQSKQKKVEIL